MKQSARKRFAIGTIVVIAAFALLIAGSLKTNTLQAMPVGALRQSDTGTESHVGQRLRIRGFVSHKPVKRVVEAGAVAGGAGSTQYFEVVDGKQTLAVEYRDVLPETFKPGSPVQVDGLYYAPGKLRAERVLTKCPSKYQAEQVDGENTKKTSVKAKKSAVK